MCATMSVSLPEVEEAAFGDRLRTAIDIDLSGSVVRCLWQHYCELARWSGGLSLIGHGTADEIIERHYAESLAALPLLKASGTVVDLGSGAGFPGWVLAAAAPGATVVLVESRRRKALFLEAAARRASLSVTVLNARVGRSLPRGFPATVDTLTVRAVRLSFAEYPGLREALGRSGRILRWVGPAAPPPPPPFRARRAVTIGGSERRVEELVCDE